LNEVDLDAYVIGRCSIRTGGDVMRAERARKRARYGLHCVDSRPYARAASILPTSAN